MSSCNGSIILFFAFLLIFERWNVKTDHYMEPENAFLYSSGLLAMKMQLINNANYTHCLHNQSNGNNDDNMGAMK